MTSKRIFSSFNRITAQWPCLSVALLAVTVFAIIKAFHHFPLIADDFGYANLRANGRLELTDFNFLNRRPISTALSYLLFQSGLAEASEIQFPVVFFFHALALAIIADYLRPLRDQWLWASLFALYPSLHEVQFMNLTLPWALGALFWAFSLRVRSRGLQIMLVFLAVGSLESYVFPILVLPIIKLLLVPDDRGEIRLRSQVWFIALLLYAVTKLSLDLLNPPTGYALSLAGILEQARNCFSFVWSIHFYKTYWFATALQALALLMIFVKQQSRPRIFVAMVVVFLTTIPAWFLAYYAPRSVHATVLLNLAVLTALACSLSPRVTLWFRATAACLLLIAYVSQLMVIAKFKDHNYWQLKTNEARLVGLLEECPSLCPVDVSVITGGFHSDWVMPEVVYNAYVNWVARRHGLHKTILLTEEIEP